MSVTDAEREFYESVLLDPGGKSISDLRYAYFLAALDGSLPGGGGGSSYELRGTGFPNGAVTADPGVYYTDTAGTSGAWRWLKKTGTGNNIGWVVSDGDTGWIDFSGSLDAVWDPTLSELNVSRVGSTVFVTGRLTLKPSETTPGTYWEATQFPEGLRPVSALKIPLFRDQGDVAGLYLSIAANGFVEVYSDDTFAAPTSLRINTSYRSGTDAWPT